MPTNWIVLQAKVTRRHSSVPVKGASDDGEGEPDGRTW